MTAPFPASLQARYEPDRILGSGAMGEVWRARDRELGREVAIKLMIVDGDDVRARFTREARTLAALRHPHIVQVLDHGEVGERMYLVMEAVEGTSFEHPPAGADVVDGWMQVGEALQAVHEQGIVHRDVKPANALLAPRGRAVLIDFGLVDAPDGESLTKTGATVGTLAFLAPEVLRGQPASPASDWYSWGVALFFLVEGRLPYQSSDILDLLAGKPPGVPSFTGAHAGTSLEGLVQKLLSPAPRDRPATWSAIQAARTPPEATSAPAPSPPRSSRPLPALALAGTTLAAALLGARFIWSPAPRPPPPPAVTTAAISSPAAPPASLVDALTRLERFAQVERWRHPLDVIEWSPAEARGLRERLLDPRFPLAFQRVLDENAAWMRELADVDEPLEVTLRHPSRTSWVHRLHGRGLILLPKLAGELSQHAERRLSEDLLGASDSAVQMGQLQDRLEARVQQHLGQLARDLGRLPPTLAAARVENTSMSELTQRELAHVDGPPEFFAWVPRASPYLPALMAAYRRFLVAAVDDFQDRHRLSPQEACAGWVREVPPQVDLLRRYGSATSGQQRVDLAAFADRLEALLRRDCAEAAPSP